MAFKGHSKFSGLCEQGLRQSLSHFDAIYTRRQNAAGEGASYAGGILSAGVDGIKVAEALAQALLAKT